MIRVKRKRNLFIILRKLKDKDSQLNLYNEDDENNEIVNPDLLHQDLDQNYINQFKNSKIECSGKENLKELKN